MIEDPTTKMKERKYILFLIREEITNILGKNPREGGTPASLKRANVMRTLSSWELVGFHIGVLLINIAADEKIGIMLEISNR